MEKQTQNVAQEKADFALSVAESAIMQTTKELLDWAISVRTKLKEKKERQAKAKPQDVQTQIIIGAKLKAFQQMIDEIKHLREKGFG